MKKILALCLFLSIWTAQAAYSPNTIITDGTVLTQTLTITSQGEAKVLEDQVTGSAFGGAAASNSLLMGGIYNSSFPTLTNGQQSSIQLDANGRVVVTGSISASNPSVGLTGIAAPGSATFVGFQNQSGNLTPVILTAAGSLPVDGSGVTQPVSGTVTANAGTGTFTVAGTVTANAGTGTFAENVTQFGGSNVATGTGASGAGIPRVTVSNDSNVLSTQSGTWSTRTQDGSGNAIGSTSVSAVNYLDMTEPSIATPGSAVVSRSQQVAGSDGTDARTLITDASGNLNVVGSVASGSSDSGNPVKVGGVYNSTPVTPSTGERVNTQMSSDGSTIVANRFAHRNQSTAATITLKTGEGILHTVCYNTPVNGSILELWDNTAASGTTIATITFPNGSTPACITYDVEFLTGLTFTTTGTGNWTMSYR